MPDTLETKFAAFEAGTVARQDGLEKQLAGNQALLLERLNAAIDAGKAGRESQGKRIGVLDRVVEKNRDDLYVFIEAGFEKLRIEFKEAAQDKVTIDTCKLLIGQHSYRPPNGPLMQLKKWGGIAAAIGIFEGGIHWREAIAALFGG